MGVPNSVPPRRVRLELLNYLATYGFDFPVSVDRAETFVDRMRGQVRTHCIVTVDTTTAMEKIFEKFSLFGIHIAGYRCPIEKLDSRKQLWVHIPGLPNRSAAWSRLRDTGAKGILDVTTFLDPTTCKPDGSSIG